MAVFYILNNLFYVITGIVFGRTWVCYEELFEFAVAFSFGGEGFLPQRFVWREVVEQELPVDATEAGVVGDAVKGELPNKFHIDPCCSFYGLQRGLVRVNPLVYDGLVIQYLLQLLLMLLLAGFFHWLCLCISFFLFIFRFSVFLYCFVSF